MRLVLQTLTSSIALSRTCPRSLCLLLRGPRTEHRIQCVPHHCCVWGHEPLPNSHGHAVLDTSWEPHIIGPGPWICSGLEFSFLQQINIWLGVICNLYRRPLHHLGQYLQSDRFITRNQGWFSASHVPEYVLLLSILQHYEKFINILVMDLTSSTCTSAFWGLPTVSS